MAWKKKRDEIQRRDHYLCKACLHSGQMVHTGTSVHHIEPLSESYGLRLSDTNLITLCRAHHKAADAGKIPRKDLRALVKKAYPPTHAGM
jgi:5-methylcytosine-specific restriction endonuclease McrA